MQVSGGGRGAGAVSTAMVPQGDNTQQMFSMFQQFQQFMNMQNRNQGGRGGDIEITYPVRKRQRALRDGDPEKSPPSVGVVTPREQDLDSQDVEEQPVQRRPPVDRQPPPDQRGSPQVEGQQPPQVQRTEAGESQVSVYNPVLASERILDALAERKIARQREKDDEEEEQPEKNANASSKKVPPAKPPPKKRRAATAKGKTEDESEPKSGKGASSAKSRDLMKRPAAAARIEEGQMESGKVERPAIMQPGDPTVMYLGGKLQRNGGGFRAFKFAKSVASRPETKIDRKYKIQTLGEEEAWSRACAYIEEGVDVEWNWRKKEKNAAVLAGHVECQAVMEKFMSFHFTSLRFI